MWWLFAFGDVVAGFAALEAVVLAVLAEAYLVVALAQRTVLCAVAVLFNLLTNHAAESFGHARRVTRKLKWEKREVTRFTPS